jgi:site-specific DNA-methyltransferase (adenine-specific)
MINLLKRRLFRVNEVIPDGSIDALLPDPYGTTQVDKVYRFSLMWDKLNRIINQNGAIVLFGSEPFSMLTNVNIGCLNMIDLGKSCFRFYKC